MSNPELIRMRPDELVTRRRRAVSWFDRGVREHDSDEDVAFILYWIAFDAAYGRDLSALDNRGQFEDYFGRLTRRDTKTIESAIWDELSTSVKSVLKNKYLYAPYWDYLNGRSRGVDWQGSLRKDNEQVQSAWKNGDAATILRQLFGRLYTLRNQLLHGGATWKSKRNRPSVEHGARIMKCLVPVFIELQLHYPQEDWGLPRYPPDRHGRPRVRRGTVRRTAQ